MQSLIFVHISKVVDLDLVNFVRIHRLVLGNRFSGRTNSDAWTAAIHGELNLRTPSS
jgi:hypothetical protein